MEKIYAKAANHFVKGVVVYCKSADSICYYESTYTNKVAKEDLIALFKNGELIVKDGDNFYSPTELVVASGYAAAKVVAIASTTAAYKTFGSEGYTA